MKPRIIGKRRYMFLAVLGMATMFLSLFLMVGDLYADRQTSKISIGAGKDSVRKAFGDFWANSLPLSDLDEGLKPIVSSTGTSFDRYTKWLGTVEVIVVYDEHDRVVYRAPVD